MSLSSSVSPLSPTPLSPTPQWNQTELSAAVAQLRLASDPQRIRQGLGMRMGSNTGSSLEFHDYRSYVAGDDLRMIDWGVYARSDQLVLRRQRQEVSPRVEIILDHSASMGLYAAKFSLAASCAVLLAELARADGSRPQIWVCGEHARACHSQHWAQDIQQLQCTGHVGIHAQIRDMRPGSERFIISDGLYRAPAAQIIRQLGAGAGRISMIQILSSDEQSPPLSGHVHALDPEGGECDVYIDQPCVDAYCQRLQRLQVSWEQALRGRGAGIVHCTAEHGFDGLRQALLTSGIVMPKTHNKTNAVQVQR